MKIGTHELQNGELKFSPLGIDRVVVLFDNGDKVECEITDGKLRLYSTSKLSSGQMVVFPQASNVIEIRIQGIEG